MKGTFDINLGRVSTGVIVGSAVDLTSDLSEFSQRMDFYGGVVFLINI